MLSPLEQEGVGGLVVVDKGNCCCSLIKEEYVERKL